jgi:predicted phage gp36 major capsid-like protein
MNRREFITLLGGAARARRRGDRMIRRREFITLLGGAAAAWPVTVRAQPADRRPLVGYLVETTKEAHASRIAAFLEGMRDLATSKDRTSRLLIVSATSIAHGCRRS